MIGEYQQMTRRSTSLAQLERDAALARVGRTRRWAVVAVAGLTAAFAALVSAIAPGHSLGAKGRVTAHVSARTATKPTTNHLKMPPLASAGDLGLQGPSSAPQPSAAPSPAQSAPAQSAPTQSAPAQSGPTQPAPSQQAAPAPQPQPAPAVSGGS